MRLRASQVSSLIYDWLRRNGYDKDFKNDIALLLSENRRGRRSNVAKWGEIPYSKQPNGKIYYDWLDVKQFITDKLKPVCKALEAKRMAKAAAAAAGAWVPHAN